MRLRLLLLVLPMLAAVVLLGVAFSLRRENGALVEQNRALREKLGKLDVAGRAPPKVVSQAAEPTAGPGRGVPGASSKTIHRNLADSPEGLEYQFLRIRRMYIFDYGEAFVRMGVDAATANKILDVLAEFSAQATALADAEKAEGVPEDEIGRRFRAFEKQRDREVDAILGAGGADRLEHARFVAGARNQLRRYVTFEMSMAGVPLSEAQLDALAETYADIEHTKAPGTLSSCPNPATGLGEKQQLRLSRASAVLSPQQYEVLRAYEQNQTKMEWFERQDAPR